MVSSTRPWVHSIEPQSKLNPKLQSTVFLLHILFFKPKLRQRSGFLVNKNKDLIVTAQYRNGGTREGKKNPSFLA